MSQTTNRVVGIDLCRGLAAFAVILVHSGDETWGIPISQQAIYFRHLFYFAVPFFLATSFYLSTKKSTLDISLVFWQKKFKQIVVPYLVWSIFYIVLKSIIFLITNNTNQLHKLLSDPLIIVFLGAASYHLYFVPLLLVGYLWLHTAKFFMKKQQSRLILLLCALVGMILRHLLLVTDNAFNLGSYIAFNDLLIFIPSDSLIHPIVRVILVYLAWLIRCSPYFFISLFINDILRQNNIFLYSKKTTAITFCLFLFANIQGINILPEAFRNLIIGYGLLIFGISISKYLKDNYIIANLGLCSFGIYLIHPFIKSVLEVFLIKLIPQVTQSVSITSILIYSISTFLISWAVISLLLKNKLLSKYI